MGEVNDGRLFPFAMRLKRLGHEYEETVKACVERAAKVHRLLEQGDGPGAKRCAEFLVALCDEAKRLDGELKRLLAEGHALSVAIAKDQGLAAPPPWPPAKESAP